MEVIHQKISVTLKFWNKSATGTCKQNPSSLVTLVTLPRTYRQPSETQFQSKANDYIDEIIVAEELAVKNKSHYRLKMHPRKGELELN